MARSSRERERVSERAFQVRLPTALYDALKRHAAREDRPLSRIVRAALRDYLEVRAS